MAHSSIRAVLALGIALLLLTAPVALAGEDAEDEHRDSEDGDAESERDDAHTNESREADEDEDASDAAEQADEEREEADERAGDRAEREVKVHVEATRALFELEREDAADGEEEVKLDYDADEGVMKLEFAREANDSESAFEYKLELERVVEYVDVDGNGVFDKDVDDVVSEFDVDEDMTWAVLGVEDITAGNATGKKITAEGAFKDANGTMGLVFYAFGDFTDLNGTSLKPTEVKFDFVFTDYPYANASSALALELKAEYEAEYESATGDAALNATAGDVTGYFAWADWAFVDGVETPVLVSGLRDEREASAEETKVEQRLYLNYARGAVIVHDPVLGVAYASTSTSPTEESGSEGTDDTNTGNTDTTTDDGTDTRGGDESPPASKKTPAAGLVGALATLGLAAAAVSGVRRRD